MGLSWQTLTQIVALGCTLQWSDQVFARDCVVRDYLVLERRLRLPPFSFSF